MTSEAIIEAYSETGLQLNPSKCEMVCSNIDILNEYPVFNEFKRVKKEDLTLLGAPVQKGKAVDKALDTKTTELKTAIGRLSLLPAHDVLCLLRNALAMSKLLYILRTAPRGGNPRLTIFDDALRQGLSSILNVSLIDDQWLQASMPVQNGGLGVRSAGKLEFSSHFASAASTLPLQNAILANSCSTTSDPAVSEALDIWKTLEPVAPGNCFRKVWDNTVTSKIYEDLLSQRNNNIDKARLKATGAAHAGDWLNATPILSLGLRLSDEAIRVAVGHRLGSSMCYPHTCVCDTQVDARGLRGLH